MSQSAGFFSQWFTAIHPLGILVFRRSPSFPLPHSPIPRINKHLVVLQAFRRFCETTRSYNMRSENSQERGIDDIIFVKLVVAKSSETKQRIVRSVY